MENLITELLGNSRSPVWVSTVYLIAAALGVFGALATYRNWRTGTTEREE